MSYLDIGCRNEDMHHSNISVKACLGILFDNSREAADLGTDTCSSDLADAIEFALRRNRKSRFYHIYTEFIKLPCDFELLFWSQRNTRSLFSIPESSIKNAYSFINKRPNFVEGDSPQRFLVS